ncbi:MAG: hypothetical protein KJ732_03570 [Candidatus Margulisbacteria bacterium]|nr:hypothetical protein [Candidatus Margulisiibacteriota bacterium]
MKRSLLVGLLLLGVILLSSCGLRTESNNYYYSPSWIRAGAIIYIGQTSNVNKDILGSQVSSSYTEWVKTIYPAGTGESSVLWDATGAPPYAMTASPVTDYVAYGDDLRSGLYRKVVVRNIASGTHTGLELTELAFNPGVKSFDWSNDGTKLVYCTTAEVRTVDIDGGNDTLVTAESNLEFVAWKYGARIAFIRTSGSDKLLSVIYSSGSGRVDLLASASVDLPQISSANTNEVFGINGGNLAKVDVSAGTPATTTVKASFTGVLPRLSPDAANVTYSKSSETSGIYSLAVATGTETNVK